MQTVNEGTAVQLTVALRGDDGSLQVPTTLSYRVDCDTTGEAITGWTSLTPASLTTISIPATSNAMRDTANTYEDRRVTVKADDGLSTQKTVEKFYRVKNLGGVP